MTLAVECMHNLHVLSMYIYIKSSYPASLFVSKIFLEKLKLSTSNKCGLWFPYKHIGYTHKCLIRRLCSTFQYCSLCIIVSSDLLVNLRDWFLIICFLPMCIIKNLFYTKKKRKNSSIYFCFFLCNVKKLYFDQYYRILAKKLRKAVYGFFNRLAKTNSVKILSGQTMQTFFCSFNII